MRRALTGILLVLTLAAGAAVAAETPSSALAGRPLAEALGLLQAQGLALVFSTELVRPAMRVEQEPRSRDPREALDEILAPHGLAVRPGPGGRLLVVSAPLASPPAPAPAPSATPPARIQFEEKVEVPGHSAEALRRSATEVSPAQVTATAGGLENVFHTLQLLPGVTAPQQFGGRLAVRGGAPDENLTVMDGVEVHNPYRLFGLTSAFNPETVDRFVLSTGSFSARHGDRLSSLLEVDSRDGSAARRAQGAVSLGITDSNVVLEGRLPRGHRGSWLATARRTYYDLLAERFLDANFPDFADLQLRASWEPKPGQKLTIQGLRSREGAAVEDDVSGDQFEQDLSDRSGFVHAHTRTNLASATWDASVRGRARSRTILSFSSLADTFDVEADVNLETRRSNLADETRAPDRLDFVRTVGVRDFTLRQELFAAAGRHSLDAGLEVHRISSHWGVTNDGNVRVSILGPLLLLGDSRRALPDTVDSTLSGTRLGAWVEDRLTLGRHFTVVPGLRLDHVGATGETLVSPRLSATFALNDRTRFSLATGLHYQSPGYEKLFQADDFVDLTAAGTALRSERALQSVLGVERDLGAALTLRVEAYARRLDRLITGRLENEAERTARLARYDFPLALQGELPTEPVITTFPVNDARGSASGLELLLSRKPASAQAHLRGFLSYSLAKAEREEYGVRFPARYSRRHAATLVGQLHASSKLDLALSAQAASGTRFTPARGVRVAEAADVADTDGDGDRGELVPAREQSGALVYDLDYGGVATTNSGRLPASFRVDFRLSFRPRGTNGRWTFYVDVINAFNHRIAFMVTPELRYVPGAERPVVSHFIGGGFPRLPSFGVRFRF